MSNRIMASRAALCALLSLLLAGCGSSSGSGMVNQGSWYVTGFRWPHDGNPYESDNLIVYSDAASDQAKQTLAELAEDSLAMLHAELGSSNAVLVFPPHQDKIHIYAYRDHFPTEWGGWAYYGGLLIYSLDHPIRDTALHVYLPVLRHELMHVVESLLKAGNDPRTVDIWLTEGVAELVAGGTAGGAILDAARFNDLIARFGLLNPIAMHQYNYPDVDGIIFDYYYPMFQLAVTYLVDTNGHGNTMQDLRDLFLDVRSGVVFAVAFEDRLGIALQDYEDTFFQRMGGYLH